MSLFEWLGESLNPGGVGGVGHHENRRTRTRWGAICTGVIALGVCLLPFIGVVSQELSLERAGIRLAVESVYLVIAYHLKPEPDTDNLGVFGMFDHPFRYSDDINRFLLFFLIALFPGRLLSIGLVDFVRAFRRSGVER
jgi:hypothetical protein